MIDVGKLVAKKNTAPLPGQSRFEYFGSKPPVDKSEDLTRIVALPRRPQVLPGDLRGQALTTYITAKYARENPNCRCAELGRECITKLRLTQAWALHELATTGGLLGCIGVGHGKTILDILAPLALPGCKLVVLLVPPKLVSQLLAEYELVGQHFVLPSIVVHGKDWTNIIPGQPVLHVYPYSQLSNERATLFLETLAPDAIIADEVHLLRHASAVRTSRVLRYFAAHQETRFCGWSGSITDSSVKDYAHLSALALRYSSPLPLDPETVEDWSRALDPSDNPAPAGALIALCNPGEHIHSAYHRRLVESQGVVSTTEPAIDAELIINERKAPEIPATVKEALTELRASWTRPDGEELVDAIAVARCAWQLACGFFYRWKFVRGESVAEILEWLEARKQWRREVREKVRARAPHLDSPKLVERAAARAWGDWKRTSPDELRIELAAELDESGDPIYSPDELEAEVLARLDYKGDLPVWKAITWPRWKAIKAKVHPKTEPIRIDDFLVQDAAEWARTHLGVVWTQHVAFGEWIAEVSGLTMHGGGPDAGERIRAERGGRSIIASIRAHGTGTDGLQFLYREQLVANPPSSATGWEQLLGRLHRIGQKATSVTAEFYRHTPELSAHVDKALSRALYVENTLGASQKIRKGWNG